MSKKVKVKLFWVSSYVDDLDYNDYESKLDIEDSEWEEITEDECYYLSKWCSKEAASARNSYGYKKIPVLIQKPVVEDVIYRPAKLASELLKEVKEAQEKKEATQAKRAQTILKKKQEAELKKLQNLAEKYGKKVQ